MIRHGLGAESSQWAGDVELALRTAEALVPGAGGRLQSLNGQIRRQVNAVGPLTQRVREMAPEDTIWRVQGPIPSGGGFIGPGVSLAPPDWASSSIILYAAVDSSAVPGVGRGFSMASSKPISSFSYGGSFGSWEVSNGVRPPTNPLEGGFGGSFLTGVSRLFLRFYVGNPTGGTTSGSVDATFRVGVLWLP